MNHKWDGFKSIVKWSYSSGLSFTAVSDQLRGLFFSLLMWLLFNFSSFSGRDDASSSLALRASLFSFSSTLSRTSSTSESSSEDDSETSSSSNFFSTSAAGSFFLPLFSFVLSFRFKMIYKQLRKTYFSFSIHKINNFVIKRRLFYFI